MSSQIRIATAVQGAERGIVLLDLVQGLGATSLVIALAGRLDGGGMKMTAVTILVMNGKLEVLVNINIPYLF